MNPSRSPAPPPARPLPAGAHVVLVRFGSLGDVVKCTALPRLIKARFPDCRLTMVTAEAFAELIRDNPHIDRAIGFERREGLRGLLALGRRLRAEGVHLVVDVHQSLRSRVLRWTLRAPAVGYTKRTWQRLLLIRFRINTYRPPRGKEEDFLAALAPWGVTDDGAGTELFTGRVARAPAFRERLGPELARIEAWRAQGLPVVGVAPVAAWELKRWPLAHFRTLMEAYVARTGGGLLVFGGPRDADAHALAAGLGGHALSLVGRTSLLESAHLASLCDTVVANDTGMTHLSEAAGVDVVALFGPTSRELGYYPTRPGSAVVERPLPCRPCTRMGEGRCTHPLPRACLVTITPDEVLARVLERLGPRRAKAARAPGAGGAP